LVSANKFLIRYRHRIFAKAIPKAYGFNEGQALVLKKLRVSTKSIKLLGVHDMYAWIFLSGTE